MLQTSTLRFLKDLKNNNNKEWFDANRKWYETARADFAAFVGRTIEAWGKTDDAIAPLAVKDCLFRINRDVRFSKNKAPYKSNFGASLAKGGKKSGFAGYYLHIEPGNESFVGGGLWMPEAEPLKKVRQEIDYHFEEFDNLIKDAKFKTMYAGLYTGEDSVLSRPPKGYDASNPAIEYLKFKSYIALHPLKDAELTGKNLLPTVLQSFEALYPLIVFLNTAIES